LSAPEIRISNDPAALDRGGFGFAVLSAPERLMERLEGNVYAR
jgi:hypothetical protein